MNEHRAVLGGVANANGDEAKPIDSAQKLFESGETFKHLAIGWSPDWTDRYDLTDFIQITPSIQFVANPAYDPAIDNILDFGFRARLVF